MRTREQRAASPIILPRTQTVPTSSSPTIRSLTRAECDALLARNHVGRIAFSFHDRVDVQPIGYVYEAGWIFGRTSEGHKLTTLEHNRWLAFEVDEVRGPFDWASVVVHGSFHVLDPEGTERDQAVVQRAVHLLRDVVPESFTAEDPVAFRTVLFRISVGEMTGRAASSG
jgi:nitroimidazol reductase NimA-like FMN-containing flavoprotein (pyridoxamine 5'-phosphate oxidase superfamily)